MPILTKLLLSTGLCIPFLHAEVQPVNIVLNDAVTSYSVPAGKTLIMENFIWALESGTNAQTIIISPSPNPAATGSFQLRFGAESPDIWTPPRPLRLVGGPGARVSILKTDFADWRNVLIMGLLVDNEDLYAANIDLKMKNAREIGDRLAADVKYSSPRPRITKVQSSKEEMAFLKDQTAKVKGTTSKTVDTVSVKTNEADTKFIRVAANARSQE